MLFLSNKKLNHLLFPSLFPLYFIYKQRPNLHHIANTLSKCISSKRDDKTLSLCNENLTFIAFLPFSPSYFIQKHRSNLHLITNTLSKCTSSKETTKLLFLGLTHLPTLSLSVPFSFSASRVNIDQTSTLSQIHYQRALVAKNQYLPFSLQQKLTVSHSQFPSLSISLPLLHFYFLCRNLNLPPSTHLYFMSRLIAKTSFLVLSLLPSL